MLGSIYLEKMNLFTVLKEKVFHVLWENDILNANKEPFREHFFFCSWYHLGIVWTIIITGSDSIYLIDRKLQAEFRN